MRTRPRGSRDPLHVRALLGLSLMLVATASPPSSAATRPVHPDPDPLRPDAHAVDDIVGPTLRMRRTRVPDDFPLKRLVAGPWRFDFELTLGRDGPDLVLVDGAGVARRFVPRAALADGRFVHAAADGSAARVLGTGARHTLHDGDGTVTTFVGGRPVTAVSPSGRTARWRYAHGRPTRHDDGRGRALAFDYVGERLRRVRSADSVLELDGATTDVVADGIGPSPRSWFGDCPADTTCDTDAAPAPTGFVDGPGIPGAIRRDLRPGSCRSHFVENVGTRRGQAIEHGLAHLPGSPLGLPTTRRFPAVDFVGERELVIARSRDLTSATYADTARDALLDRLLRDGADIERLLLAPLRDAGHVAVRGAGDEPGIRRIDARPAREVVLELIVRHGMASPDQVRQIERARRTLATRHGVVLRVVEIP